MAVYTKITQAEIAQHLQKYQLGQLIGLKEIIEGIDNSNFILETTQGKFIFTIFESRIDKNDLPFFVNFKLHLAQKGILCPRPILDNSGSSTVEIKGKESAIVTFLSGANLKAREDGYYDNITPNHCFEVGKTLAKLHEAAKDFSMSRPNELGANGWNPLFSKFRGLAADYEKNLDAEISEILNFLKNSWRFDLRSAACHLDLFPDNVFFDANAKFSGVIDFYFAATEALVYDFAIIVNAWCFDEKNNFSEEKFSEMLRGYEEVRKFSDEEKNFLKIALVGAAMRFLLTRLNDMLFTPKTALVKIKNPQEYLAKLRFFYSKL
ncbi:MAG: homoserine kinase [Rickettsiales bacterium]|nr:homoserine kinase [Rickettsiales bacterium]